MSYHVEVAIYRLDKVGESIDTTANARVLRSWVAEEAEYLRIVYGNGKGDFSAPGTTMVAFPASGCSASLLPGLVVVDGLPLETHREHVAFARLHDGSEWTDWIPIAQTRVDFLDENDVMIRDLPASRVRPRISAKIEGTKITRKDASNDIAVTVTLDDDNEIALSLDQGKESIYLNGKQMTKKSGLESTFEGTVKIEDSCQRLEVVAENKLGNVSCLVKVFHPKYDSFGKVTEFTTDGKDFTSAGPADDAAGVWVRYHAIPYRLPETTSGDEERTINAHIVVAGAAPRDIALRESDATEYYGPSGVVSGDVGGGGAGGILRPEGAGGDIDYLTDTCRWMSNRLSVTPLTVSHLLASTDPISTSVAEVDDVIVATPGDFVDASVDVWGDMTVKDPTTIAAGIRLIAPPKDGSLTEEPLDLPAVKNGDVVQAEAFSVAALPKILLTPEEHVHDSEDPASVAPAQQVLQDTEDEGIEWQVKLTNRNDLGDDDDEMRDGQDAETTTDLYVEAKELTSCPAGRIGWRLISQDRVRLLTQEYLPDAKVQELLSAGQKRHQILSGGYVNLSLLDDSTVDPEDDKSQPKVYATVAGRIRTTEITKRRYLGDKPSVQAALAGSNPRAGAVGTHRSAGLNLKADDGSVYVHNGELFQAAEDLVVKGTLLDFQFLRTHQSHSLFTSSVGRNWDFIGNARLVEMLNGDVLLMNGQAGIETYKAGSNITSTPDIETLVNTPLQKSTTAFDFVALSGKSQYISPAGDYRRLIRAKALDMPGMAALETDGDRFYLIDKSGMVLTFVKDSRYEAPADLAFKTDLDGEPNEPPPGLRSQYLLAGIHHRVRARHLKLVRDAWGLVVGVIDDTPLFDINNAPTFEIKGKKHTGAFSRVIQLAYEDAPASADRFLTKVTDFTGRSIQLTRRGRLLDSVAGVECKRSSGGTATPTTITYNHDATEPGSPLKSVAFSGKPFITNRYNAAGQVEMQVVSNNVSIPAGKAAAKFSQISGSADTSLTYSFDYSAPSGNMTVSCYEDGRQHDYDVAAGDDFYKVTSHTVMVKAPGGLSGTFQGQATTTFEHNSNGEITKITWPRKNISTFKHDALFGHLLESSEKGLTTTYGYANSPYYLPTSIVAPYVNTTISYDKNGNHATTKEHGVVKASSIYNDDGLLLCSKDARGIPAQYGYYSADRNDRVCGDAHHGAGHLAIMARNTEAPVIEEIRIKDWDAKWVKFGGREPNKSREVNIVTSFRPNLRGDNDIVVDACGYTHAFEFNELSLLLKDDRGVKHSYDVLDRPCNVTIPGVTGQNGGGSKEQSTSQYYDQLGNVVATESAGMVSVAVYDLLGNPVASVDPAGYKSVFSYDTRGLLLTEIHDASGVSATSQYAYDKGGNRILSCDPEGWWQGWRYDGEGRPTHHLSTTGLITEVQYDKGNLKAEETQYEPMGLAMMRSAGWDKSILRALASALQYVVPVKGKVLSGVKYEYDSSGRLEKESRLRSEGLLGLWRSYLDTTTTWTADDQPLTHTLPENVIVQSEYNSLGQLASQTVASPKDPSAKTTTSTQYDAMGRPIIISEGHAEIHQTLDRFGQVTHAREALLGVDTLLAAEYDLSGNALFKSTIRTDEICQYDSAGRLASKKVVSRGTNSDPRKSDNSCFSRHEWKYLSDGRLDSTTITGSDGASITQKFDDHCFFGPRLTSLAGHQVEKVDQFDLLGNKTRWQDANGTDFIAAYDGGGGIRELTAQKDGRFMHRRTFERDAAGRTLEVSDRQAMHYKGCEVVSSARNPVTCGFQYDTLGHLVSETQTIGGSARTMRYDYTPSGHRSKTLYPATGQYCVATGQYAQDGSRIDQADTGLSIDYDNDPVFGAKSVTANGAAIAGNNVRLVSDIGYDPKDSQLYSFKTTGTNARLAVEMVGGIDERSPELSIKTHLRRPAGAVHPTQYVRKYRRAWGLDSGSSHHNDLTRIIGVNTNSYLAHAKFNQSPVTKRDTKRIENSFIVDGGLSSVETTDTVTEQANGAWAADDNAPWSKYNHVLRQENNTTNNALGTTWQKNQLSRAYSPEPAIDDTVTNRLTLDDRQLPQAVKSEKAHYFLSNELHFSSPKQVTQDATLARDRSGLVFEDPLVAIERNVFGQPVVLRDLADVRNGQCTLSYDGLGRLVLKERPMLFVPDVDTSDYVVINVGATSPKYPDNDHVSVQTIDDAMGRVSAGLGRGCKWILRIGKGIKTALITPPFPDPLSGHEIIIEGAAADAQLDVLSVSQIKAAISVRNLKILKTCLNAAEKVTFDRCDLWALEASKCKGTSLQVTNCILHDEGWVDGQKVTQEAGVVLTDLSDAAVVFAHNIFDLAGTQPILCKWNRDETLQFSTAAAYNNIVVNNDGTVGQYFIATQGKDQQDIFSPVSVSNHAIARAKVPLYDSTKAMATCANICSKFAWRGVADVPTWVTKQYGRMLSDKAGVLRHYKHPTPGPVESLAEGLTCHYLYDGTELVQREAQGDKTSSVEITRIVQSIPERTSPTIFIDSDGAIDINMVDRLGRQVCLYRAFEGKHLFQKPDVENDHCRHSGILSPLQMAGSAFLDYPPYCQRVMEGDQLLGRQGVLGWDQVPRDWTVKLAGPQPEMQEELSPINRWLANLSNAEVGLYGTGAAIVLGLGLVLATGTVITGLGFMGAGAGTNYWSQASREDGGRSWWALSHTGPRIANVVGDTMIAVGASMALAPGMMAGVGALAGTVGGATATLFGSTVGLVASSAITYGTAAIGVGLFMKDVYDTANFLNENSDNMDAIDVAGAILPRIGAFAGGWAVRSASASSFRIAMGRSFNVTSRLTARLARMPIDALRAHHPVPRYLGGSENEQRTTIMSRRLHRGKGELTSRMRTHLRSYRTADGRRSMDWESGWSGKGIQRSFGRESILKAISDFYQSNSMRYPDAALNFFLDNPALQSGPGIILSSASAMAGYEIAN